MSLIEVSQLSFKLLQEPRESLQLELIAELEYQKPLLFPAGSAKLSRRALDRAERETEELLDGEVVVEHWKGVKSFEAVLSRAPR